MSDDIIRNPNRSTPVMQKPYEPERVRLSKDPSNVEEMYASVDGGPPIDEDGNEVEVVSGHIIDNNEYMFPPQTQHQKEEQKSPKKLEENVSSPKVGDYILMVFGKLIASGPMDKIEDKVKDIMYGDDKDFAGLEIGTDDIVVLKRVSIKVGIFIND